MKSKNPSSSKVVVRLRGGLGNQLFQLSAGVGLARKTNSSLGYNLRDINNSIDTTRRSYLGTFDLSSIFNFSELDYLGYEENRFLNSFFHRFGITLGRVAISDENITIFFHQEAIASRCEIRGWFEKSFFPGIAVVDNPRINLVSVRPDVRNLADQIALAADNIVMHVRLGDFIANSLDVLSREYFLEALKLLRKTEQQKVFCFSDDIETSCKMLGDIPGITFPEQFFTLTPPELLYIFSRANNFVSSKSTLSWWGAYIASKNSARIISPWGNELHMSAWERINSDMLEM
jgi:hypothetical protein